MKTESDTLNKLALPGKNCAPDRNRNFLRWPVVWLCAAVFFQPGSLRAASFNASLDRDTITLGESAMLSLTFEGGSPPALPEVPPVAGLSYGGSFSHSVNQSIDFGNNSIVSRDSYLLSVTPQKAGEFIIPAVTAEVEGRKLTTKPIRLIVVRPTVPTPEDVNAGTQLAFLKLLLPKKEVYLGEVITAELQFFFRQGVQLAASPQITATPADGFTVGKIAGTQQRQVQLGKAVYNMIPASVALKAIKTGPVTIGPITANIVVQIPSNTRRRDPFFERFGVDFFGMSEQKQLSVATGMETLQSLPLPKENMPGDFSGAVGSYTMTASVGPTNVAAGDPITVRVQISGHGALDALTLPDQGAWKEFKAYPPTSNLQLTDQLGLQGTKTFEQIISAENSNLKELPEFSFSFFDPETRQYRTLTQPAVGLIVRPGAATPAPSVVTSAKSTSDAPPPAQDIVHIKPRLGTLAQVAPPLIRQPWFVALQSVPVFAWLAAAGWRKRIDLLANNPRLRRQRQVAQVIRAGLTELGRYAAASQPEEFFATLFRLLQEQLGERLDLPASAITEAVIEEKLRPRGVVESTLTELHQLFQTCNLARYAPVTSGQELAALLPRFESVIRELQNLKT